MTLIRRKKSKEERNETKKTADTNKKSTLRQDWLKLNSIQATKYLIKFIILNITTIEKNMNERFKLTCAISSVPLVTVFTAAAVWSLGIIAKGFFVAIMGVVGTLVYI